MVPLQPFAEDRFLYAKDIFGNGSGMALPLSLFVFPGFIVPDETEAAPGANVNNPFRGEKVRKQVCRVQH